MRLILMKTVAAILLMALPLAAHDLYLVADGTGAQRKVCARVGEHFPDSMNAMPANRVHLFQARSLLGTLNQARTLIETPKTTKLTGVVEEAAKQLCAPLPEGIAADVVEMTVNPVFIRLQAKDFNGYIQGEGFKSVIVARKRKGTSESEGRELYSRYTKIILPNSRAVAQPVGHIMEIVPETPAGIGGLAFSTHAGEPNTKILSVRVLFKGKPLAGVRVSAVYAGAKLEGHSYPVNAETDSAGRAQLKIDRPGLWYARLIHMVPAKNDPDVDWRSFFATMTFTVPEK